MHEHPANAVRPQKECLYDARLATGARWQGAWCRLCWQQWTMMAASLFYPEAYCWRGAPSSRWYIPYRDGACLVIDMGANTDVSRSICNNLRLWVDLYGAYLRYPVTACCSAGQWRGRSKGNQQSLRRINCSKPAPRHWGLILLAFEAVISRRVPPMLSVCDGFVGTCAQAQ